MECWALQAVQRHLVPSIDLALPANTLADSRATDLMFQVTLLLALSLPGCSLTPCYRAVFMPNTAGHVTGNQESQALQEV